ncbi:MAG: hypothetical protein D3924_10175 [Candidatus Electrothrix sp. AR4]|nr:hypothetical protein [Candidatus Electrothrix sp. AR4]
MGCLKFKLERECLDNLEDKAGRFQISGGKVYFKKKHVANYSTIKRISCGTRKQNTAMLWISIFFLGKKKKPPENMTLHGSHDFSSGGQIGSVSAASTAYAAYNGYQFHRIGDTLYIG